MEYLIGIMKWREDFYIRLKNGIYRDVHYYHTILTQIVSDHVRFRPYYLYMIGDELEAKLTGIR